MQKKKKKTASWGTSVHVLDDVSRTWICVHVHSYDCTAPTHANTCETFKDSFPAILFSGKPIGQQFITCSVFLDMCFSQPLRSLCSVCLAGFALSCCCQIPLWVAELLSSFLALFFSVFLLFSPHWEQLKAPFPHCLRQSSEKEKLDRDGHKEGGRLKDEWPHS